MTPWSICASPKSSTRVFSRPLGATELSFYWDAEFNGTADTLHHVIVEPQQNNSIDLFTQENIYRTWICMKQRFPLLGCQLNEHEHDHVFFVLDEKKLTEVNAGEVLLGSVASWAEAQSKINEILNGPRHLSKDLLACVYIFRRTDEYNHFHVLIHIPHVITDGMSGMTVMRVFLDTLSSLHDVNTPKLENRLAMALALEDLTPRTSPYRQKWRHIIARILVLNRTAKMTGGHALPRTISSLTASTPARSSSRFVSLSLDTSATIITNCRRNEITFGQALPVLGQVAQTRVLYRRYLRGNITEEEWEYRKRQPMHTGGPINLRPYLDPDWYKRGGGGEVGLAISFYYYTLPFMPLGCASRDGVTDGAPPCSALLSAGRFFLRCKMIKKQAERLIIDPSFLDIAVARTPARVGRARATAMHWRNAQKEKEKEAPAQMVDEAITAGGPVFSFGGSSLGNLESILPVDYPLHPSNPLSPRSNLQHPARAGYAALLPSSSELQPTIHIAPNETKPTLHLHSSQTHLHCRPTELYLGAATSRKQLHLSIFWDSNVYDDALVEEWLAEVKNATEYYLGRNIEQQAKL